MNFIFSKEKGVKEGQKNALHSKMIYAINRWYEVDFAIVVWCKRVLRELAEA